ncbi:MAG: methyltransferase/methylesterase, CheR/CheB with sensor [Acidobacteria bacterium]|nr:methyltransferase/methylesterase, CheR/CheB with sensor [Acidobacteriota bacterium]
MAAADDAHDSYPLPSSDGSMIVVGLGGSAGGITALKDFFAKAPTDAGIAYVVILHLSPDHESRLAEVLQTATVMPVMVVTTAIPLEPDHVYVIPPRGNLRMIDGSVTVTPMETPEERRSPVDVFFRTLAESHGSNAVAVVLSGTGADGSNGIKRINEAAGLVIAQEPREAEYGDMPNHAVGTGVVDLVLPVAQAPEAIVGYQQHRKHGTRPALTTPPAGVTAQILTTLRVRTGHDFSNYKPATVLRRIERRMALHKQATHEDYETFLRETPAEPAALMKELLISVTHFFRDAGAYSALEAKVLPRLFDNKGSGDFVRAWIAGCATGEEAYSIAMLLAEAASTHAEPPRIQVFATDLDAAALARARDGHYTEADVADVPAELLRRYLQPSGSHGYRIGRNLRDLVVFAHHNLIKDPPFSHMDLITCRNLLIYLNRAVQARVLETFHFALRPGGYLFLGTSETAETADDLFVAADKGAHIFESRLVGGRPGRAMTHAPRDVVPVGPRATHALPQDRISPADLHQRLLDEYGGPSLVVTEDDQIVHVSQAAVRFLAVPAGEPSRDLRKVIIPELRVDLLRAVHQATRARTAVEVPRIVLPGERGGGTVRIVVRPVLRQDDPPRGYLLVLFSMDGGGQRRSADPVVTVGSLAPAVGDDMADELSHMRTQLRATIEQYEGQVEEAKASNEELQAMNEELRSAAEELETSKEELQSVNEELTTVNQELKIKIEELGLTNNDFKNFINATDIGTIFLDRAMRVKLATSGAREVFNLLPGDIGRKLSDITSVLVYDQLQDDINVVLERLERCERELESRTGRWYLMRILPYRTSEDRIDGVVMTFVDITHRREIEARAKAGEERLRLLIESAVDYAIFTMTSAGNIDTWNAGAQRMFRYTAADILGRSGAILFTPEDRATGAFEAELKTALTEGRASDERYHVRSDGSRLYCSGVTTRLGDGAELGFAKIARDLTAQREAELQLVEAYGTLEVRVEQRTEELQSEVTQRTAAQENVTNLMRRLVTAQEEQRTRIARDLHDQVGQQLTALRLTLDRIRDQRDEAFEDNLTRAAGLARDIDAELDFLAWELRPAVLDDLGLLAALPRFVNEWSGHHGIAAEFRTIGFQPGDLSGDAEVTFYRVTQEALNNIVKHAHAARVDVILEERDGFVSLVVEDDGVGFDPSDPELAARGVGLAGMRERAAVTGATLQIESTPGKGSTVFLRQPVTLRASRGSTE